MWYQLVLVVLVVSISICSNAHAQNTGEEKTFLGGGSLGHDSGEFGAGFGGGVELAHLVGRRLFLHL